MWEIKKVGNPYLHNLFKAVLIYDADKVKRLLEKKVGGKLLTDWKLVWCREESEGQSYSDQHLKFVDVMWELEHKDRELGYRMIKHEIKTGKNIDAEEIMKGYKDCRFQSGYRWSPGVNTNFPLYLWIWRDAVLVKGKTSEEEERKGTFRIVHLDWIVPILEDKLKEFISQENGGKI